MFAAALALAAAVSWGIGDFLGGVKSRTLRPIAVLIVAQPIGGALLGLWVAIRGEAPPGTDVFWASLAAVFGTIGLIAFYRGMAAGALSIVAPIAGAGAAIPVVWGLARGDNPSAYQELGFVVALAGVVLASFERRPEAARLATGVGSAAIAMVCFGASYIPMHAASQGDFAVVLLDVGLPGRDGVSVAAELHALQPRARLVFVTANPAQALHAAEHGIRPVEILPKPFDLDEVVELLGTPVAR